MLFSHTPSATGRHGGKPRWYFLYFLLAAFDVVTVSTSLFLNHRLTELYRHAVVQNQAWAQRLADLSTLRTLAGAVNAPGNDVFDTRDVDGEMSRLSVADEAVAQHVAVIRREYDQLPDAERARLLERLAEVLSTMGRMKEEAGQIFGLLRTHEAERAGERMATMDRAYASVNAALTRAEEEVRGIHAARLEEQASEAAWLRRIEYVIAVFVLVMIGGVMVYGHAMSTALKRASEERDHHVSALQANEARTRAIVQSAKDGILTFDERGIIQSANPALATLVGTTTHALVNRPLDVLVPTLRDLNTERMGEALLAGAGAHGDAAPTWTVVTSAGDERRVDLSVAEVPSESGRLFSAVMHDVTAQHQIAASLDRARQAAEDASLAKSTFLANMSHELRTPLNAIIGYSEMLCESAEERDDRELVDDLTRIRVSGRHLLDLISNILDLSKVEAGKVTLHCELVDLRDVMADVEATARPLAAQQHNTLTVTCSSDLPPLRTDALKVRQILLNLVGNACKFTQHGSVRVSATVPPGQRDGVTLVVSDSGIGMTEEQIGRLFKPFAQADPSTTRKFGGTGLGLALARRFAELLGGDVSVSSQLGVGSEFTVRLRSVLDETPTAAARPSVRDTAPTAPLASSAGYVLVVEDDVMAQEMLTRQLAKVGLRSKVASTATDALRMCRADRPAAMTLDMMLPDIHGLALLGLLKNDPALRTIPVIVVSILDDRMSGYAIGAHDYLVKPVDADQLTRALSRVLPAHEGGHVLVVDDDADARAMMARRLQTTGIPVKEAVNGREALDSIRAERPVLILLDLMMPEVDGFEVLERLATDPTCHDIPVMVVTARDMADTDMLRLNRSVVELVRKRPAHVDQVLESVSRLVLAQMTSRAEAA